MGPEALQTVNGLVEAGRPRTRTKARRPRTSDLRQNGNRAERRNEGAAPPDDRVPSRIGGGEVGRRWLLGRDLNPRPIG
jgi:hypothetical protein